jgi:hypothetical protein
MTTHPSHLTIFENLQPNDVIKGEDLEFFTHNVLHDVGCVCAYAITGYADWLHYTCIRYIEAGGWPDLHHIGKFVTWPDDIDDKTRCCVIDNIYAIIQPIVIEAQHYKKVPEPKFNVEEAINWMIAHTPKEKLDKICEVTSKAMEIMERGFRKNQPYKEKNKNDDVH